MISSYRKLAPVSHRETGFHIGHTASELRCLRASLNEARRRRRQCLAQRQAEQLVRFLRRRTKDDPPQANRASTQPTTGAQAGAPAGFPGLFHNSLCNFVHVPVTVPVPITLNIPVTLSSFVSMPVPTSASVPVVVPSVLLVLAHVASLGPPASPFSVGLGGEPRHALP
ncbi:hypothetical protein P4O66_016417, partial [Electrophorus voltai]